MTFESWFQLQQPSIATKSALSVLELAAEGGTVPFIARYRKEKTGNLDEVQIRAVLDGKERYDEIVKRQAFIVGEIESQGKLTPELKDTILKTFRLESLEDLYLPYKKKRKTKATIAKEAGLEPLAEMLWSWGHGTAKPEAGATPESVAASFVDAEKNVKDVAAALNGAQDILIERLSETKELREFVRRSLFEKGFVRSTKGEKAKTPSKFDRYFEYAENIPSLLQPKNSHRYLALRRGWTEEELAVSMGDAPGQETLEKSLLEAFEKQACTVAASPAAPVLHKAARFALKAYVYPSIESEVHKSLKEVADEAAIQVFVENVKNLLMASPFGSRSVLGIDPGVRTGCKLALVDDSGAFLGHHLIHLHSETERERAAKLLALLCKDARVHAIAVGNGTAGRETETFAREALKKEGITNIPVVMVNEAGASVYSASDVAREEFPDLDLTIRGAISIARRLQDPLAELVKIDPKSIGVGQYQHDVSPTALKKSLDGVVDSCVNRVGVNLNTASQHLLARVSGIGPALAKSLVEHRAKNGLFKSRAQLLEISRFSKKTFEQSAGFLRISGGDNPLDNTGVHPERYPLLESLASRIGKKVSDLVGPGVEHVRRDEHLKKEAGDFTFGDIIAELEKPGRDPREAFVPFAFRDDIRELKDLKPNMTCPGIVTNVTNFGAFVDIGVHQDGLVHISQLSDRFVKDPREVVNPGDHVEVRVLEVNVEKRQISLSMKSQASAQTQAQASGNPRRDTHSASRPPQQRAPGGAPQHPQQGRRDPRDRGGRPQGGGGSRPQSQSFANNPFSGLSALKDLRNSSKK